MSIEKLLTMREQEMDERPDQADMLTIFAPITYCPKGHFGD